MIIVISVTIINNHNNTDNDTVSHLIVDPGVRAPLREPAHEHIK